MKDDKNIDADNNKTILDDGIVKTEGVLHAERRRNKVICLLLVILAAGLAYWSSRIEIGGLIAFLFIVIPVLVIAFVYYSKVKRAGRLLKQINDIEDPLSKITIREHIEIKRRKIRRVALIAWLVGAAWMLFEDRLHLYPAIRSIIPLASFVIFGWAVVADMHFVRCPRCNERLGPSFRKENFCPSCGVSFDEAVHA